MQPFEGEYRSARRTAALAWAAKMGAAMAQCQRTLDFKRRGAVLALVLAAVVGVGMVSSRPAYAAPLTEGPLGPFVGDWTISGTTRGKAITTGAEVRPVFGGAFLEMHIKDPAGAAPYEARVFIGRNDKGRLIVHWLDATGGETSQTVGMGDLTADGAKLGFPYPGNEFRDRLDYDRAHDRWRLIIEMGPPSHPQVFSDWDFDRVKPRRAGFSAAGRRRSHADRRRSDSPSAG